MPNDVRTVKNISGKISGLSGVKNIFGKITRLVG